MPPAASPITDEMIHQHIVRAVQNVCSTMLSKKAGFLEKLDAPNQEHFKGQPLVLGCVGFVGNIDGVVYLCLPNDFATSAASHILGLTHDEVLAEGGAMIKDVVGEITNVTVGTFKNALCDLGHPCKLTLPTIARGENLHIATLKSATRHIFHFDCVGHRIMADIQIRG